MYFLFDGNAMFSRNGAYGWESKTTRMFRPVRRVAAPAAKSAVADWVLFSSGGAAGSGGQLTNVRGGGQGLTQC